MADDKSGSSELAPLGSEPGDAPLIYLKNVMTDRWVQEFFVFMLGMMVMSWWINGLQDEISIYLLIFGALLEFPVYHLHLGWLKWVKPEGD